MDKNTGTSGIRRPHIDTLFVVYGHAFLISPVQTSALGTSRNDRDYRDDASVWLYCPAGRGE